jgi:sugar lactone lactonase YvrE
MHIDLALDLRADLGEGPIWDARLRRLLFLDIMRGEIHTFDPATGDHAVFEVGQPVGAITPTKWGDWVAAARDGFYRVDPATGATMLLAAVEADLPDNRMNDGYCDPQGRFWAGTMSMVHQREAGALYRLDPDRRVTRILAGVTTSNGIDWSPDGSRVYYVDTGTGRIDLFDFDAEHGQLLNRRPLVAVAPEQGKPDGLIVDEEGYLWLALWGGGALHRYSPDGTLDRVVPMPVSHPTKCAFGGPDLADLYVTSASTALSPEERASHPHAGSVFRMSPGVRGRAARLFAG